MKLAQLVGQIVRVKVPGHVGKKRTALLLATSRDGTIGYLRLTKNRSKIQARDFEIFATPYGRELAEQITIV